MMTRADAYHQLLQLNEEHKADGDGGYVLVGAIRRAQAGLSAEDRPFFAAALGDLVRDEHPQLWGVALEALVQSGDHDQVVALGTELASSTRSAEWTDNVVLALLRLGDGERFRVPIVSLVRASLKDERTLTVPTLAALCRVDRETCLELAVDFFEDAHIKRRSVDGFIPAFVRNFVAVDEAMLGELVSRLWTRCADAGQQLAASFEAYISKPWILKELGSERVETMLAGLRNRTGRYLN